MTSIFFYPFHHENVVCLDVPVDKQVMNQVVNEQMDDEDDDDDLLALLIFVVQLKMNKEKKRQIEKENCFGIWSTNFSFVHCWPLPQRNLALYEDRIRIVHQVVMNHNTVHMVKDH